MLAEAMAAQDNERLLREAEEQEALMREREAQSQFRRAEMRRKVQAVRAAQNTDGKPARENAGRKNADEKLASRQGFCRRLAGLVC